MTVDRSDEERIESNPTLEDSEDAYYEGDRVVHGTALAALRHRTFTIVFAGAFFSNIGTWMQNVVLGAIAYNLSHSGAFVGIVIFAQLGPLLLLSAVGGLLADTFDRKFLLITVSLEQAFLSMVLALVVAGGNPSKVAIVVIVFGIGIGQAVFGPTYSALLPALVGRRDLPGAISLNSAQMNGSRVIGPVIGAAINHQFGAAAVFNVNAATYLFVIGALLMVKLPPPVPASDGVQGMRRVLSGVHIARSDPVLTRCLVVIAAFSLLCLPFIGQFSTVAAQNLHIDPESSTYGWLYTAFGFGAMLGALSIGTVFSARSKEKMVRGSLLAFAAFLALYSSLRSVEPAYVTVAGLGLAYFALITSLSTVLQERLADHERGRVMALWIMGFGGTVPIGNLVAGPLIDATNASTVLFGGVVAAIGLFFYANLHAAPRTLPAPSG